MRRENMTPLEGVALWVAFVATGFSVPWWGLAVTSALFGFWKYQTRHLLRMTAAIAAAAWLVPALVSDAQTGFRISWRVGLLMKAPTLIFVYAITLLIASCLGSLGSSIGSNLRAAFQRSWDDRKLAAGKRAG